MESNPPAAEFTVEETGKDKFREIESEEDGKGKPQSECQ